MKANPSTPAAKRTKGVLTTLTGVAACAAAVAPAARIMMFSPLAVIRRRRADNRNDAHQRQFPATGRKLTVCAAGAAAVGLLAVWMPVAAQAATFRADELRSVSCVSASSCTAVGDYVSSTGSTVTLAESWNGSTWKAVASPSPGAFASFYGVSCVSASSCVAVGFYNTSTSAGGTDQTLIESWNGSTWNVVTSPNPSSLEDELYGISCTTTSSCTAVGTYANNSTLTLVS